ncbi:class I tRNA ligase family protein [Candidatus Gracilibacteria bacterium]|nr:class I tRNA ligase family protein [Candidatus Gracilibacteria bacterium]
MIRLASLASFFVQKDSILSFYHFVFIRGSYNLSNMKKAYDHLSSEDKIYKSWEDSGKMRADNTSSREAFTIPLPPPNVTGQLHLGHAAMLAIEDILIRYKKMSGYESLWIPGTDHAAIATENVVLKHLGAKSREEFSREEFLEHCRKFAGEKHDTIVKQTKKMGAWLDWSREAYTFDEERNFSVNKIFKQLYEDGLIVRGHRLINWSAGAQSVLADDEVEWEVRNEPFYYIRCGEFVVGTVRSETKCADSPVVVNPEGKYVRAKFIDSKGKEEIFIISQFLFENTEQREKTLNLLDKNGTWELLETKRGKELEGKSFEYETYAGMRKFYVMADEVIDMEKGTGAMTISCNHSADDYGLGKRKGLENLFFDKIDFEGKMKAIAGACEGMRVAVARKKSAEIMKEKGLLVGEDKTYEHRVPLCYRSECVVEPMVSPQWFVSVEKEFTCRFTGECTTLKKLTQEAVRNKHVKIIPERFEKTYFQWIDNLHDWCISRQIWWGHQIPVWYDEDGKTYLPEERKLLLVRHGQSEANMNDIIQGSGWDTSLSQKGRNQAKDLAEKLAEKGEKISRIVCSDLKRAHETAQIIAERLGMKAEVFTELREMGFGDLEGKNKTEVFGKQEIKIEDELSFIFDNEKGEKFESVIEQKRTFLEKIKSENEGITLVVSHEITISIILAMHRFGEALSRETFAKFVQGTVLKNCNFRSIDHFNPPKQTSEQKIILARHGQTDAGKNKIVQGESDGLNENGRVHAQGLIEEVKDKKITKIIASHHLRAKETAEIIAKELNLNVEYWDEFSGIDFGEITGTSAVTGVLAIERSMEKETGETSQQVFDRVEKGWQKLENEKSEGSILVIAHRSVFSAIDAVREGSGIEGFLKTRKKNENADFGIWGEILVSQKSELRQDADTLDTWFSSALWPFSILGWPNEDDPDFQKFYPNSVLETGHDILFFWVARMIMFGRYATGKYPFHTAYLHGMVTDEKGKKMSKSKGNGIDPLVMIEKFGADPVRLALVIGSTPGQKIPIGEAKISGYRNFVNKLWNAGRFVQMQLDLAEITFNDKSKVEAKSVADKWIASRFSEVAKTVRKNLETYDISKAGEIIYHFVWNEFCDWFLETQKVEQNPEFLAWLYFEILTLVHPLCPFVTEKIFKRFWGEKESIMDRNYYPEPTFQDKDAENLFKKIQNIVFEIRKVRADKKLNPKDKVVVKIKTKGMEAGFEQSLRDSTKVIQSLANLSALEMEENMEKPEHCATVFVEEIELFVEIPFDAQAEKNRITKEIEQIQKQISGLEGRLANKSYIEKAPKALVNQTKEQLKNAKQDLEKLEKSLKTF